MPSEEPPERVVLPRKSRYTHLPIVAVAQDIGSALDEDGTLTTLGDFVDQLPYSESCLIVTTHSAQMLGVMQRRWERTPGWISKSSRRERVMYDPVTAKYGVTLSFANIVPHLCGWRRGRDSNHITFRLQFHFLDPDLFYASEKTVQDVFGPGRGFTTRKLMNWGQAVRQFCEENDLPIKQTQGALGAKFLTDTRFYPESRRKVPKATNDRLRSHLPGNHSAVAVRTGEDRQFAGHYLDQRRAHHHHAQTVRLPCANSLFAYGDFTRLKRLQLNPSAFLNGGFHGVVAGDFAPPERGTKFLPARWRRRAVTRRMVSTAEWSWFADVGARCLGLYAAWGSTEVDTGISAYAAHAERELDRWEARSMGAAWVKPILVSTYGALAVNVDTPFETLIGGAVPENREVVHWDAGSEKLYGYLLAHTKGNTLEPATVNVIHRYLIEAATQVESIAFADYLDGLGYSVLMVHVDAVIVEDDDELPPPPLFDPWRYKSKLTGLTFYDDSSFDSVEMTRMPGRPHLKDRKFVAVERPSRTFKAERGLLPAIPEP